MYTFINGSKIYLTLIIASMFFVGCTIKQGDFAPETHFSYPNSNVKPLGQVKASIKKASFIKTPDITAEDVNKLFEDALGQKPGADLIINYKTTTTSTMYPLPTPMGIIIPLYNTVQIDLEGTAASMDIGLQELQ